MGTAAMILAPKPGQGEDSQAQAMGSSLWGLKRGAEGHSA